MRNVMHAAVVACGLVATSALATGGPASAADMPVRVPAYKAPAPVATFSWTGTFLDDSTLIDVSSWFGSAAVYNTTTQPTFPTDFTLIGVKPVDGSTNLYPNADKAGSPENEKTQVIAGALGTGSPAYTGGNTSTGNPTAAQVPNLTPVNSTEKFSPLVARK